MQPIGWRIIHPTKTQLLPKKYSAIHQMHCYQNNTHLPKTPTRSNNIGIITRGNIHTILLKPVWRRLDNGMIGADRSSHDKGEQCGNQKVQHDLWARRATLSLQVCSTSTSDILKMIWAYTRDGLALSAALLGLVLLLLLQWLFVVHLLSTNDVFVCLCCWCRVKEQNVVGPPKFSY